MKLKYTVIKSKAQYEDYAVRLKKLVFGSNREDHRDEIDLLTLLVERWDESKFPTLNMDPVQLLQSFMKEHGLIAQDLVLVLGISKGYVSDILNYKKGLSKNIIRKLALHFAVRQEAFNRPYKLSAAGSILKSEAKKLRV
ncbi:MAG: transcriptional regulator [Chitinophagaceae bacterium]|nr:MAG: transcriptional regulator [Chitinophagaceae bacterium]